MIGKILSVACAAIIASLVGRAAHADSIDFTQWGAATTFGSPLAGVNASGNTFVVTNGSFLADAFEPLTQGSSWSGTFPASTNLLYSTPASSITLVFANPLSTMTLGAESNNDGAPSL